MAPKTMNSKCSILVIEDQKITREMIAEILEDEGYEVFSAENGEEGLLLAESKKPDLILLDLGLPDIDGAILARKIRRNSETKDIFIVVLSARDGDLDIVAGLEAYADDYITKPFQEKMLTARVKAVLRRKSDKLEMKLLKINDLVLNPKTFTATVQSHEIVLSKYEFDIMFFLASRPNWIFSREQIVAHVKGDDFSISERAIDMSIARLRKKLGDYGKYIETVRGAGYRFVKN